MVTDVEYGEIIKVQRCKNCDGGFRFRIKSIKNSELVPISVCWSCGGRVKDAGYYVHVDVDSPIEDREFIYLDNQTFKRRLMDWTNADKGKDLKELVLKKESLTEKEIESANWKSTA